MDKPLKKPRRKRAAAGTRIEWSEENITGSQFEALCQRQAAGELHLWQWGVGGSNGLWHVCYRMISPPVGLSRPVDGYASQKPHTADEPDASTCKNNGQASQIKNGGTMNPQPAKTGAPGRTVRTRCPVPLAVDVSKAKAWR